MSSYAKDSSQQFHYEAFISYRHKQPDAQIAQQLARALETYRLPHSLAKAKHIRHIGRVFRDQDELPTSSNLGSDIEAALAASKWLIVICSPDLPQSQWCQKEIAAFIAMGRRDRILALLVRGEPAESFPMSLRFMQNARGETIEIEPLAADIRADNLKGMSKKLRTEKLRLLAPMLGVGYDDLRRRARERRLRTIAAITAGVATLSLGFGLFAFDRAQRIAAANVQLESQQIIISTQRDDALLSQSKFITELAREQYEKGNREVASLALKAALPNSLTNPARPLYADALGLLRRMELERGRLPFDLVHLYDTNTYEVSMKPDGTISVWLQAEEPAKTAADRWTYPSDYYYLSPDGTVALQQVTYVPDDPDLPPPNSVRSYFEVRAFAYPSMQPLSTFRPFPEYSTVGPYVSGSYAVGVSQYEDSGVVVWDYRTGERLFTLDACREDGELAERQAQREARPVPGVLAQYEVFAEHGSRRVSDAFIREDGGMLVVDTANVEGEPLLCGYDIRTGQRAWELSAVNLWRHSRDGAYIAVYDWQGGDTTYTDQRKQVRVYDTLTGSLLRSVDGDPIQEVAFGGADNDLYVNAGSQYTRYSLRTDESEALCGALDHSVGLDVSPDGQTMLAEYVIDSQQHHYVYRRLPAGMRSAVYGIGGARSGDGQRVFVYGVGYEKVDVYSGQDFSPITSFALVPSEDGLRDESPCVSYDGTRLFFRGNVYDVATGKVLCFIPQGTQVDGYESDVGFSRDNQRFITYVDTDNEIDGTVAELYDIRCYDARTGAYQFSYGEQLIAVNPFTLTIRDGQLVLTDGFYDRGLSYYDINTGRLIRRDLFPDNRRFNIRDFSPDGSLVALVAWDKELSYDVLVLDTATGKRVQLADVAHVSESSSSMPVLFRDNRSFYAISGDSVVEIAVSSGAILRTVLTAPVDARLRASDFEIASDDRTIFKSRMGDVWRLTDGSWYGTVPVRDSEKILFGDTYIFNFGVTSSRWHERADDAEYKPELFLYHLRSDAEVFEAMLAETQGQSLTPEERKAFFIP